MVHYRYLSAHSVQIRSVLSMGGRHEWGPLPSTESQAGHCSTPAVEQPFDGMAVRQHLEWLRNREARVFIAKKKDK